MPAHNINPKRRAPSQKFIQRPRRMRGVALITVLLIVVIATVLVAGMMRNQYLALQRAGGLFSQDQAWLYTQGAEQFVEQLLIQDYKDDQSSGNLVDSLGETWAQPFPPFPVDGGVILARVTDAQARFNINRLWHDGAPDAAAAAIFQRLLQNLDLPTNLAPAVTDWIDPDPDPTGSDGAEDDYYSRMNPPYSTANRPLTDISELRLIKGFTPDIIARLSPYICTLPATAVVNVNTTDPVVLASLSASISASAANQLIAQRPRQGYASVDIFLTQPVFNGLTSQQKADLRKQIDVRSHYFLLLADANIDGRHSMASSVLARSDSGILQVVSRDFSQKLPAAVSNAENASDQNATDGSDFNINSDSH